MDKKINEIIIKFRIYRTKKFEKFGRLLIKMGLSAKILTTLSLIFGLISIYFLFLDRFWFIVFILLHLILDGLDGVVARLEGETEFGKYFDYAVDRIVLLGLLLRIGFFSGDYFVFLIAGLMLISQLIYVLSKFTYPILFSRSIVVCVLLFGWYELAYLSAGVISVYNLAVEFREWLSRKQ